MSAPMVSGQVGASADAQGDRAALVVAPDEGRSRAVILVCVLALFLVAPFFIYPVFLMKIMCFAVFAGAFNLLLGYGGLISFGHAAFFGTASYVAGYLLKTMGVSPELAVLTATLSSAALGLVFGAIAIRRQGIYFAMITLALAQIVYFASLRAGTFTGGEDGIQAIARGQLFGLFDMNQPLVLYGFVFAVFAIGLVSIYRIIHSPFGKSCLAISDNEPRAISLGYSANRYKLVLFVISAALSGAAGATKVLVFQLASLVDIHWSMSGEVVLMTLIGGVGTLLGPIVGAAVMVVMSTYLAEFGAWIMLIQGIIFVSCVLLFREGIVGMVAKTTGRKL